MFDEVFDAETLAREERRKRPVGPPLVHTEQELADACERVRAETDAEAYARGKAEGIALVADAAEVQSARAIEAIARTLPKVATLQHQIAREARKDATALALLVGRKLAGALLARWPAAEVEAMIEETLTQLATVGETMRVAVRVPPPLAEEVEARVAAVRARTPEAAEIAVLADDTLAGSECRMEWRDGGAERDPQSVERAATEAVQRFVELVDDLPEFHGDETVADEGPADGSSHVDAAVERLAAGMDAEEGAAPEPDIAVSASEPTDASAAEDSLDAGEGAGASDAEPEQEPEGAADADQEVASGAPKPAPPGEQAE